MRSSMSSPTPSSCSGATVPTEAARTGGDGAAALRHAGDVAEHEEPWLVDDVWSDDYEHDVDQLQRAGRGIGISFVVLAVALLAGVVFLIRYGVPAEVLDDLFTGTDDG